MRFAAIATALLLATACGPISDGSSSTSDTTSPKLADVTPLKDLRSWKGEVHAGIGDSTIDPITTDPVQQLPAHITDAQGTKVTVKDTSRILALDIYGTLSQTVFELGLGKHVVGRDVSTQFAEAKKLPLVTGNGHELNAEAILGLNPSVIITDTSLGPWDVVLQMRDAGIPVVVVDSTRSIGNTGSLTMQVARALGVESTGTRLAARTDKQIDAVRAEIAKVAPHAVSGQLRAVFLYVRGNAGVYYMFGDGTAAEDLIKELGLYDVASEIDWKGMKPVTDEGIVAAQPDLILMMTKGLDSAGGVDGLLEKVPALAQTPAGRNKRIVDMEDSQILSFGPRTADVLNALAVAVYAPESLS